MLFGVFLFQWRRKQIIFCIIVDHGFRKNFILRIALGGSQLSIHKGGYLIHI